MDKPPILYRSDHPAITFNINEDGLRFAAFQCGETMPAINLKAVVSISRAVYHSFFISVFAKEAFPTTAMTLVRWINSCDHFHTTDIFYGLSIDAGKQIHRTSRKWLLFYFQLTLLYGFYFRFLFFIDKLFLPDFQLFQIVPNDYVWEFTKKINK